MITNKISVLLFCSAIHAMSYADEGKVKDYQQAVDYVNSELLGLGGGLEVENESLQLTLPEKISFDFNGDAVRQQNTVLALAAFIRVLPNSIFIRVTGHSDAVGNSAYNSDLGMKRAGRVMVQLVEAGVDPGRIIIKTKGESQPVVDTVTSREINRRVEIELISRPVS